MLFTELRPKASQCFPTTGLRVGNATRVIYFSLCWFLYYKNTAEYINRALWSDINFLSFPLKLQTLTVILRITAVCVIRFTHLDIALFIPNGYYWRFCGVVLSIGALHMTNNAGL